MKNIFKALVLLAGVASLASCVKYADYNWTPFASLYLRSATIEESAEGTVFSLPVRVYNTNGAECTVTYTIEEGSAKSGVNFTPLDNSGVLNFSGATDSLAIKVNVIGQPGEYTGNQTFKIKLASATNNVTIGTLNTCTVTIKDLDHPLSAMFGEWSAQGVTVNSSGGLTYQGWTANFSAVEGDPTKIAVDHISPFSVALASYVKDMPVVGTVSEDKKTISFEFPQTTTGDASAFGYTTETFTFYGHDGEVYTTAPGQVVFTLDEASGAYVTTEGYGFSTPSDLADYPDLFYYYAVVYSGLYANYPTVFAKK